MERRKIFLFVTVAALVFVLAVYQPLQFRSSLQIANQNFRPAFKAFFKQTPPTCKQGAGQANNDTLFALKDLKKPDLLPEYKNPCWRQSISSSLLCSPYVYLAGFPKSGTTDLHFRIIQHPFVIAPLNKEPHYLTRLLYSILAQNPRATRNIYEMYVKKFFRGITTKLAAIDSFNVPGQMESNEDFDEHKGLLELEEERLYSVASRTHKYPYITIDSSASTIWDSDNWYRILENAGCEDPVVVTADIVTRLNPDVKIIVIMREPVSRVFSDYVFRYQNPSPTEFHKLSEAFITQFNDCLEKQGRSLLACTLGMKNHGTFHKARARIQVGLYHVYIAEWLKRLPRENFLFLRSESYNVDIESTLKTIYEFLGFPELRPEVLRSIAELSRQNTKKGINKIEPMFPKTREMLTSFYKEHNAQLVELLHDERFYWNDV